MFRVAIAGCGGIGKAHMNAWRSIEDINGNRSVEIAAVIDIDREKAEAAAKTVGCGFYTDISELPNDIDAVSVTTPPAAHYAVAKAALERSFNVFCEKPMTMDVSQGIELKELAEKKNLILAVGFKMRFEPVFTEAKKHIGEVGKLRSIVSTKLQAYNPKPEASWIKGTGAMYELSVHDFDLISYITGLAPVDIIYAKTEHRFGWKAEDAFSIMADYGNGVTAQLQGMYAVSSIFCYRDLTLTFLGDNGYIRVERPDRIIIHTYKYKVIEVPPSEKSAFVLELTHFKECVERGEKEKNTLTPDDAIRMTEFINKARNFNEQQNYKT